MYKWFTNLHMFWGKKLLCSFLCSTQNHLYLNFEYYPSLDFGPRPGMIQDDIFHFFSFNILESEYIVKNHFVISCACIFLLLHFEPNDSTSFFYRLFSRLYLISDIVALTCLDVPIHEKSTVSA